MSPQLERTPTILIVEDESFIRGYVADFLRDQGFAVIDVPDGPKALQILDTNTPIDLVFTDITLPGEPDGLGLAKWIRNQKPHLPVILTSGRYDENAIGALSDDQPFFTKPFDVAAVASRIRAILAGRKP